MITNKKNNLKIFKYIRNIRNIMRGRQNWSEECENKLNQQINTELEASYAYMQMASYFMRQNVGVDKLVKYFSNASMEEREHAEKFIKYQNIRI